MGDPTMLFTVLELRATNPEEGVKVIEDAKLALASALAETIARVIIIERDPEGATVPHRDPIRRGLKYPEIRNKKA